MGGGGGAAAPVEGQGDQAAAAEEVKVEEKTHFDIELTKFEASGKIKIIKEIRGLFGLGLKEAKELVESAPVWIKKESKKEEAEDLKEKLTALGAEIRLA